MKRHVELRIDAIRFTHKERKRRVQCFDFVEVVQNESSNSCRGFSSVAAPFFSFAKSLRRRFAAGIFDVIAKHHFFFFARNKQGTSTIIFVHYLTVISLIFLCSKAFQLILSPPRGPSSRRTLKDNRLDKAERRDYRGRLLLLGVRRSWSLHQKKIGKPIDNTVKRTMKKIPNKLFTLLRAKSQRFCIKSTSTHSPVFKERMEKNFLLASTI